MTWVAWYRTESKLEERTLVRSWRVVGVDEGRLVVAMPHPLLRCAEWDAGSCSLCAEGVSKWKSRSSSVATQVVIGTARLERRDFGVPDLPRV